jgi:type IV secretory pathway VirB2 component (pilin)
MNHSRQLTLLLCLVALTPFLVPAVAFASTGSGGSLPYETWLSTVRNSISGPVAFTVSLLAMVGGAATLIFQGTDLNAFLRWIIYFVIVVAFVVAAQNVMSGLLGHGAVI